MCWLPWRWIKGKDELVEVVLLGASPCVGCHGAGLKGKDELVEVVLLGASPCVGCHGAGLRERMNWLKLFYWGHPRVLVAMTLD